MNRSDKGQFTKGERKVNQWGWALFFTSTHKDCRKCGRRRLHEDFSKDPSNKYGLAYWCKECAAANARRCHALKTTPKWKAKRSAQGRALRIQVKQQAVALLGGKCTDCQQEFPMSVFDFHHIDPTQKDFSVGKYKIWNDRLQAELKKCILLCANCHRIRHFEEDACDDRIN
jgi:hypothetical protein